MRTFGTIVVLTILSLGFMDECEAQYIPEISSYNIYWNKLDAGQTTPTPNEVVHSDTTMVFLWERGDAADIPYITTYIGDIINAMVIVNSPTLWTDLTAGVSRDIILDNGTYEVTVTESDIYNYESAHSQPIYIEVAKQVARIQINVRTR